MYGGMVLGEADENLADLQPEDSDSDDEMQQIPQLSAEQKVCRLALTAQKMEA